MQDTFADANGDFQQQDSEKEDLDLQPGGGGLSNIKDPHADMAKIRRRCGFSRLPTPTPFRRRLRQRSQRPPSSSTAVRWLGGEESFYGRDSRRPKT